MSLVVDEIKSLLTHAIVHAAKKGEYLKTVVPRALVDRQVAKELSKFLETTRAPTLAERLKQYLGGGVSGDQDIEALSYAFALSMLSVGFFGQIVFKLDPKLLVRIVESLSQAFAGALAEKKS